MYQPDDRVKFIYQSPDYADMYGRVGTVKRVLSNGFGFPIIVQFVGVRDEFSCRATELVPVTERQHWRYKRGVVRHD